jgi:cell division protein FtsZ
MTEQSGNDTAHNGRALQANIKVVGVGGAGGNGVNNMISAGLEGVEFLVVNTDGQALDHSLCDNQIQLGMNLTKGLGAGSIPEIGKHAAVEARDAISNALQGTDMTFITAGMGGGTGTGAAPVIAQIAREQGVLTVGVVSMPFAFEGAHRMRQAEAGIAELAQFVDTLIVVPNQKLFSVADERTTFAGAFKLADQVLHFGVRGVTDLVVLPGLVNLDIADVRTIMTNMGRAVMGTGEAEGNNRALVAAEAAISNPLIGDVSMKGARSVLVNITGGLDLMLMEVDEAANRIREEVDPDANIIFGSAFNSNLEGKIRVSVIATGNDIEFGYRSNPMSSGLSAGDLNRAPDRLRGEGEAIERSASSVETVSEESVVALDEPAPMSKSLADASEVVVSVNPVDESLDAQLQSADTHSSEAPLNLRVASTMAIRDGEQDPMQPALNELESETVTRVENLTNPSAELSTSSDSNDPEEGILTLDQEAGIGEGVPRFLRISPESTSEASPKREIAAKDKSTLRRPFSSILKREPNESRKRKFRRLAKPAKSESTLEAFDSALKTFKKSRQKQELVGGGSEKVHYLVWEIGSGARIYKVKERNLNLIKKPPGADKLKLVDDLEKAKAEVRVIFTRVAVDRAAKGLPSFPATPSLQEMMRLEEKNVPDYFL